MLRAIGFAGLLWRLVLGAGMTAAFQATAPAEDQCHGHRLLANPRPAMSCQQIVPKVFDSPDRELQALVVPAGVSLYATPDIESRVVIRSAKGDTLTSHDYSSPRGTNGYYVDQAKWTPDSRFFVFSMISSGGHSPWSFPTMVYSRQKNEIAKLSDMIEGRPLLSGSFQISAPHLLSVVTWKRPGDLNDTVTVTVDLEKVFATPPAPPK